MNKARCVRVFFLSFAKCLAGCAVLAAVPASAAVARVNVVDFAFSPANVVVNVNDDVAWTWLGAFLHSTTSTASLWDSGLQSTGFNFTNTFKSAGNFPYICSLHLFAGSVTVQGQAQSNAPPIVSITTPTNGSVFAAPWTGTIQAAASDSDGTVAEVDFLAGTTLLGIVTNPPSGPSVELTNFAVGNYTLTAVAADNGGAVTTSPGINISVVAPAPITLSSARRPSVTAFQFDYAATLGLSYVVERSADLSNWVPRNTNTAGASTVNFSDNATTARANFYRIRRLPNP